MITDEVIETPICKMEKEALESKNFDVRIVSNAFDKVRVTEMAITFFAIAGVGSAVVEYEIDHIERDEENSLYNRRFILLSITTISTLCLGTFDY